MPAGQSSDSSRVNQQTRTSKRTPARSIPHPLIVPPPCPPGSQVVVAQSYARIFFRNCISTGELYPVETDVRLCDELQTGQDVTVDMERDVLINHTTGKEYSLKPIGEVGGPDLGAPDLGGQCWDGQGAGGSGESYDRWGARPKTQRRVERWLEMLPNPGIILGCSRRAQSPTRFTPPPQAGPVIDAGGICEFARRQGMIKTVTA